MWGYINEKGEVELDFQWSDAYPFSEGLASASISEEYGYIDKQGRFVIPCQWLNTGNFGEGLAPVNTGLMKWGYINKEGRLVIPAQWSLATDIDDGTAYVYEIFSMTSGYIDRTGRFFNPSHPLDLSADELEITFPFDDDFEEDF